MKTLSRITMPPLTLFVTAGLSCAAQTQPNNHHTTHMKTTLTTLKHLFAAALLGATLLGASAQTAPLRSYAISGTNNVRSYSPATGWTYGTNPFTGTLDFLSPTNARLTKIFADGTSTAHELILGWYFDPTLAAQGGTAVELPDPLDPIIKRTTYNLALGFDGVRHTASGNFLTRAWMSVIAGRYEWMNVAYGDFSGQTTSPLGSYTISGSEKAAKRTAKYTGTLTLSSPTTGTLTRNYANGTSTTVNIDIAPAVDLSAANQTVTAVQTENASGQRTIYAVNLQSGGTRYSVNSHYSTTQTRGRRTTTVATGSFTGLQE